MSELPESVRSLLLKIHALATRGVAGEAEAAQRKLDDLLQKHGVTLDDIVQDQPKVYEFKFSGKHDEKLVFQCYVSIDPQDKKTYAFKRGGRKVRSTIGLNLTPAEYIDYCAILEHYRAAYARELERFYTAFIHKHKLFPKKPAETSKPKPPLDPEELESLLSLMGGLREKSYRKPALRIGNRGGA